MENVNEIQVPTKPIKDELVIYVRLTKGETELVRTVVANEWIKANPTPTAYSTKNWSDLTKEEKDEYMVWTRSADEHIHAVGYFPFRPYRGRWGYINTNTVRATEILALVENHKAHQKASSMSTRIATHVITKINNRIETAWCGASLEYQRNIESIKAEYRKCDEPLTTDFEFVTYTKDAYTGPKVTVALHRVGDDPSNLNMVGSMDIEVKSSIDAEAGFAITHTIVIVCAQDLVKSGHLAEAKEYDSVLDAIDDVKAALIAFGIEKTEKRNADRIARKAALEQAILALALEDAAA